jgi:large conductance mechanosensitive channel
LHGGVAVNRGYPEREAIVMNAKSFWNDFRQFAFKGNMINLAVAVVIGSAFGAVVNSLVKNIIMPIISYIVPQGGSYRSWHLGAIEIGPFLGEVVNFLIISLAMFLVVAKLLASMEKLMGASKDEPKTKDCPFCLSDIPARATKCAQCTADLPRESDALPASIPPASL